jgi:hypothetical protein
MVYFRCAAWAALAVVVAVPFAAAAPAPAPETPLAPVPADVLFAVQLRGFERSKDRLLAGVKATIPDFADKAKEQLEQAIKNALDGRELKGLSKDAPVFLVGTDNPLQIGTGKPPPVAFLLPVARYAEFRDGFLKEAERKELKSDKAGYEWALLDEVTVYFVDHGDGYAVVTPDKDLAERFTKKYDGLDRKLGKEAARRFTEADVALYLDVALFNKKLDEQIKQARKDLEQGLLGTNDKAELETIKKSLEIGFQAVADGTVLVATGELRPGGVALQATLDVAADSTTGALLKDAKPGPLPELGKMPAGQAQYIAAELRPALFKELGQTLFGTFADDEADTKKLKEATDQLLAAGPSLRVDCSGLPLKGLQVWQFEDPAKASAAFLKLAAAVPPGGTFQGGVLKARAQVKESAEKYAGFEFHRAYFIWDLDKVVDKQGVLGEEDRKRLAENMKGVLGESLTSFFGTDGKVFLHVYARDWAEAREMVDRYLNGHKPLGEVDAFKEVRKGLPAESTYLYVLDVPAYARVFIAAFEAAAPPGTPMIFTVPDKDKAAFLGLAVTARPRHVGVDVFVPAGTVTQICKIFFEKSVKGEGN